MVWWDTANPQTVFNIFLLLAVTYVFREAKWSLPSFGKKNRKPKAPPANENPEEEKKPSTNAALAEKGVEAVPAGGFLQASVPQGGQSNTLT